MNLDWNTIKPFLMMGAGGAAAGTALYQLKSIPRFAYDKLRQRLIYRVYIYEYDELYDILEEWFFNNHPNIYRNVEAQLGSSSESNSVEEASLTTSDSPKSSKEERGNKNRLKLIQESNIFTFKYEGVRIVVSKLKEKNEKQGSGSLKQMFFRHFTLSSLNRKGLNLFLSNLVEEYDKKLKGDGGVKIYTNDDWGSWSRINRIGVKSIDSVILDPITKETICNSINTFVKEKDWYLSVKIPYKRGLCLYGPPGTGKTTTALSLAAFLGKDIYVLNINTLKEDGYMNSCIRQVPEGSILLIEDIDKCYSGRDTIGDNKVSFSTFLNILDGALYKEGGITIITTNYFDKLDSALVRPGRMDDCIEIGYPKVEQIIEYLELFYQEKCSLEVLEGLSMATIQEYCIKNRDSMKDAIREINKQVGETIYESCKDICGQESY